MLQTDAKATVSVCSPTRALGGSGEAQLLTLSGAPLPSPLLGELFIPIGDEPNMSGSHGFTYQSLIIARVRRQLWAGTWTTEERRFVSS